MFRRIVSRVLVCVSALALWGGIAHADGLIVVSNPPVVIQGHFSFAPLEVTFHHVDCAIKDQVATTSVDQEFYNRNNARLEGEYIFPIPVNAQIDKFAMDIDGKTVQAELLPAEKARGIYQEIVRQSRDPALLEYAGRAMFKVHIFPIEPNSPKRIQLKYTELLKQDNGLWDYHYTLNTEKYSSKLLGDVSIRVAIDTSDPITTLYSPTHEVDIVRHGSNNATVGFEAKNIRPDTDFHLFIGRKASPVGINLLTYRPDPDKEGYFVLLASPTLNKETKAMPKDVVFVMDTSGSMADAGKIDQARQALKYCLNTMNPQDRFDVIRFSTDTDSLFGGLKDATDDNRKKAQEFAAGMHAAGSTAIDEALATAVAEQPVAKEGRMFMVVFMTDGLPTIGESNPDRILKHMQDVERSSGVRVFSFGVGNDVNTKLLDLISQQTRGYAQYVLPNENLEGTMSSFWGKVQDPIIAGLKLDTGSIAVSKITPREMPDLFKGDQLVVFGTYEKAGKGAVTLSGMADGKQQKFSQDVVFEDKTDSSRDWIAKLWATRRVGYLLDEIRIHGESKEAKDEIVEVARRWGVVTPYTAMLIIEDERRRGVPVAQQSLRELDFDRAAAGNSRVAMDSIRLQTGSQAVANSVNTSGYQNASNMQMAQGLAQQTQDRLKFDGNSALAKGIDAPGALGAEGGFGGGIGGAGGGGGFGGRGGGGGRGRASSAAAPAALADLNLGTQQANSWQTAQASNADGYRSVSNYAQQTRIVNNRSFFLNGNQWTDAEVQNASKQAKHVKVVFSSQEYFGLLTKHTDAAQYLSLGNNVTIVLDGTIYDIVEETSPPAIK